MGIPGGSSSLDGAFTCFYNFDEASSLSDAIDAIRVQNLTHHNAIARSNPPTGGPGSGIKYSKQLSAATPSWYAVTGHSIFTTGDIDYCFIGWFRSVAANYATQERIFGKGTASTEYALNATQSGGLDVFTWKVYDADGTTANTITSTTGPTLGANWVWWYVDHKASANTFRLRYFVPSSGASYDSGDTATTVTPGTAIDEDFIVGIAGDYASFGTTGNICCWGYKKYKTLTETQQLTHYNGGNGIAWPFD